MGAVGMPRVASDISMQAVFAPLSRAISLSVLPDTGSEKAFSIAPCPSIAGSSRVCTIPAQFSSGRRSSMPSIVSLYTQTPSFFSNVYILFSSKELKKSEEPEPLRP